MTLEDSYQCRRLSVSECKFKEIKCRSLIPWIDRMEAIGGDKTLIINLLS